MIEDKIGILNSSSDGKRSLKLFQNSILQLAKILGVSTPELIEIKKNIYYDSDDAFAKTLEDHLFDSETPSVNTDKKKKARKNKSLNVATAEMKQELPPADMPEVASDSDEVDLSKIYKGTKKPTPKPKVKPPIETKSQPTTTQKKQLGKPAMRVNTTTTITSKLSLVSTSKLPAQPNRDIKPVVQKPKTPANQPVSKNKLPVSTPTPLTLASMIKVIPQKQARFQTAARVAQNNTIVTATQITTPPATDISTPIHISPLMEISIPNNITSPIETPAPETTNTDLSLTHIDIPTDDTVPKTEEPPTSTYLAELIGPECNTSSDEKLETKFESKGDDHFNSYQTPLSSLTFFNNNVADAKDVNDAKDVDDDFVVTRDQFPEEFLKFITDLHTFTYPVAKKHFYLTGGAITCLYDKEHNDGGDWDIVGFCSIEFLRSQLDIRKYKHEVRGIHKIIHVTLPLQKCDLVSVKSAPTLDNLAALQIKATAAYVRAREPDGLYYINKLKNICEKIPLSPEMLAKFDKKLKPNKNAVNLSHEKLDRIKLLIHPYRVHLKSIKVEITCLNPAHYNSSMSESTLIENNLNERDLTPAAATIKLVPEAKKYTILGSERVLLSLRKGKIKAVNTETTIFDDLIQIFRLAKIKLKHKRYKQDKRITNLINFSDGNYIVTLFNAFIFNSKDPELNKTHFRQIGSKLDELFTRFDTHQVVKELLESNVIKGLTGMPNIDIILKTTAMLDDYLEILPKDSKKLGFYYFLYAIACLSKTNFNPQILELVQDTLHTANEKTLFSNHLKYIKRNMSFSMAQPTIQTETAPRPEFINFMADIKFHFASQRARALPTEQVRTTRFRVC